MELHDYLMFEQYLTFSTLPFRPSTRIANLLKISHSVKAFDGMLHI